MQNRFAHKCLTCLSHVIHSHSAFSQQQAARRPARCRANRHHSHSRATETQPDIPRQALGCGAVPPPPPTLPIVSPGAVPRPQPHTFAPTHEFSHTRYGKACHGHCQSHFRIQQPRSGICSSAAECSSHSSLVRGEPPTLLPLLSGSSRLQRGGLSVLFSDGQRYPDGQ
jgi:hypothetical protein